MGRIDVAPLAFLGAARQQDHQSIAVAPEINPVARPEIDPEFEHALADRFNAGEITLLQAYDGARDFGSRGHLQIREPFGGRLLTASSDVVANFRYRRG
jgi:hypothetical protein